MLARSYGGVGRIIYAELKTDKPSSQLSDAQREWLLLLTDCGAETYVWRPSDYDRVVLVLKGRRRLL